MESNKTYTEEELKHFAQFVLSDDSEKLSEFWLNHNLEKWKASREPKKPKPLLFTTDGVTIFDGDRFFTVDINFKVGEYTASQEWIDCSKSCGNTFSTREKAEKYIIENKPCLSYKDVMNFCNPNNMWGLRPESDNLKKIIKQKLNSGAQ